MTPLNYEQNGYGQPEPTAEDLGLTPVADVADDPRYLCCEYAFEWHMAAGPDEAALLEQARELATQTVLREELDRRELAARNEAQAAELARLRELRADAADRLVAQLNEAQKDADHWTEKFYSLERDYKRAMSDIDMKDGLITDLREGLELVRNTLRDCGYTSGALHKRIQEMHAELVQLRKASAQSGATSHRSQPPDLVA
jgi:DNA repair ATPase RecN